MISTEVALSPSWIADLLQEEQTPCVSLYLPTEGPDAWPIRLKNRLNEAGAALTEAGVKRKVIERWWEPARELLAGDGKYRPQPHSGLGLFIAEGFFRAVALPAPVEELAVVGQTWHITPLLELSGAGSEYFLLCISQKEVKAYRGGRHGLTELDLGSPPEITKEAYEAVGDIQLHAFRGGRGGEAEAVFHGHRDTESEDAELVRRYLRRVHDWFWGGLGQQNAPLIFCGDVTLFSMYRDTVNAPSLLDDYVEGNPEPMDERELHERSWPIAEGKLRQDLDARLELAREALAKGKADANPQSMIRRAMDGQVAQVVLERRAHVWGGWNAETGEAWTDDAGKKENGRHFREDLLNVAVCKTVLTGGEVTAVDPGELIEERKAVAILRY